MLNQELLDGKLKVRKSDNDAEGCFGDDRLHFGDEQRWKIEKVERVRLFFGKKRGGGSLRASAFCTFLATDTQNKKTTSFRDSGTSDQHVERSYLTFRRRLRVVAL